tara:strand:- start:1020 stop:1790 length:771 start_codon:yes stop_codon:yes gene_type:complete
MIAPVINEILKAQAKLNLGKAPTICLPSHPSVKVRRRPPDLEYLEIGVHQGTTINSVNSIVEGVKVNKESVDPYSKYDATYRMTSQIFFALNEYFWKNTYDIIFIDAFHFSPIVNQEVKESLKILKPNGVIVLHDTLPEEEPSGQVTDTSFRNWLEYVSYPLFKNFEPDEEYPHARKLPGYPNANGDVWRSVVKIRMEEKNLKVASIKQFCCSLITEGEQPTLKKENVDWQYYLNHFDEIFNILEVRDIQNFISKK